MAQSVSTTYEDSSASRALKCLQMLLRPIGRFCVRHGLTVQHVLEAAKGALIEAAQEEIRLQGKRRNVSRISIMTGIHRRDVMRISGGVRTEAQHLTSLIARVMGQWTHDGRFHDMQGSPRKLACEGEGNEFRALVACVSKDLNSGTVLFELERLGVVRRSDGYAELLQPGLSVRADTEQVYSLLARDTSDLMETVQENLSSLAVTPNLHVRTEYDNIPLGAVEEIRAWVLREGAKFHERVAGFLSRFDRDVHPGIHGEGRARVSVGSFMRAEEISHPIDRN